MHQRCEGGGGSQVRITKRVTRKVCDSVLTGFRKYSPEALIKTYNAIAGNNVYHDSPCRSGRLGALNLTLGHLEWERKPPGGSGTNATFEEGTIDWR